MTNTNAERILEVGIDYITATSHQKHSSSPLYSFGDWLVSQEVAQGSRRGNYRSQGYRGWTAGRAACGLSHQGTIVRLSAECARSHWGQCLAFADNITRLDVQGTIRTGVSPAERLRSHHQQLKRARRFRGKQATFKMWYGAQGPESCSLGNRLSDRYGRIYDKGLESKEERYQGCVRYELELHRKAALCWAMHLDSIADETSEMLQLLYMFFRDRGCSVPELSLHQNSRCIADVRLSSHLNAPECERSSKDVIRSVTFLSVQVSPTVARLVSAGRLSEVLSALGLDDFVQPKTSMVYHGPAEKTEVVN